jgi:HTH-type transcriptional regulator/antitoxin HigA
VEAYEALHHAIDPPTTRELVAYQVATLGLTARDLAPAMGSIASARALLAGRRQPTPGQAAELAKVLRLPVDELLGDDGPGGAARLGR